MYAPPENLFRRLQLLDNEISSVRLQLTEPRLGNPKYGMDRGVLTDRLESLQNQKISLLTNYIGYLGGHAGGIFPGHGDWEIRIAHIGESEARTAQGRAVVAAASADLAVDPWGAFDHEVERIVRSIDQLEGNEQRPSRKRLPDPNSVMQDDMAVLLRALGLGDHARPISPHEVMVREIIPAAEALVKIVDGYDALKAMKP